MKKIFTTFFVSVFVLTLSTFCVFAASSRSDMIYKSNAAIYNDSEFAEVEKAINSDGLLKKNNAAASVKKSNGTE